MKLNYLASTLSRSLDTSLNAKLQFRGRDNHVFILYIICYPIICCFLLLSEEHLVQKVCLFITSDSDKKYNQEKQTTQYK